MMLNLPRVLLLNYSYEPIMVVSVKKAIVLYILDKIDILERSENNIRSLYLTIPVTYVIKLKNYLYVKPRKLALTRRNVIKRDNATCQYCGSNTSSMTIDHIIPKDKGGKDSWDNLVAACKKCNIDKGNYLLNEINMKLLKKPARPSYLLHLQKYKGKHSTWDQYLYLKKGECFE